MTPSELESLRVYCCAMNGGLRDESRAKILGLNAARLFGLSGPNGKGLA